MIVFGGLSPLSFSLGDSCVQTYFEDYFDVTLFWFRSAGELHREVLEMLHEKATSSRKITVTMLCSAFKKQGMFSGYC